MSIAWNQIVMQGAVWRHELARDPAVMIVSRGDVVAAINESRYNPFMSSGGSVN